MRFVESPLRGVWVIESEFFRDDRGFFSEVYRRDIFKKNGLDVEFVQDNHSASKKGVLRGLHYQIAPFEQAKLVRCPRGAAYDAVVDIRRGSPTFGKYFAVELSAANGKTLFVPTGFAHGFLALEDNTEVLYKVSAYYSPAHERGILWNDPAVGIPWPAGARISLSSKDRKYLPLKEAILEVR